MRAAPSRFLSLATATFAGKVIRLGKVPIPLDPSICPHLSTA